MLQNWTVVRTFNADTKRLLAASACGSFAYFGVVGVLFNLYLLRLGFGIEFIGLLIAVGQTVWACMALPAGILSRRFGLRPILVAGNALLGVAMALLPLVEFLPRSWWTAWIFGFWMMAWGAAALLNVNVTPFLMLSTQPETRNHAFSANAALTGLFGFLGGVVAGVLPGLFAARFGWSLDSPAPYRTGMWLVPIAYMIAAWLMAGTTPLQIASRSGQTSTHKAPAGIFLFLVTIVFLQAVGGGAARSFFNVFLDTGLQVSPAYIGAIMGLGQLLPVLISLVTPYVLERRGTEGTLILASMILASALIVLGISTHWLLAAIGFAAVVAMNGMAGTSRNIFSQELVAIEWRSMSSALSTLGLALGWATSAALGSILIGALGFGGFFFVCAVLAGLSTVVLLVGRRVPQLRPQPAGND